jgi:glycosyltransferase involved in cell wall biosynthesis
MRFGPMLGMYGHDVIHYGVGEPETGGWADHVDVMSGARQEELLGYDPLEPSPKFVGRSTNVDSPLYREFNSNLRTLLAGREWDPEQDIICLPFGHAHERALSPYLLRNFAVETGIGYPTCITGYRMYESYAWMHWHLGRDQRPAWVSEWVVPNYFDVDEWPLRPEAPKASDYVLYFGRLTSVKGLNVVWNLAKMRPDLTFVLCGQGDPKPWLTEPNIEYREPVHGKDRAALMHGARCVLLPTEYVEPFGGVAAEAMMTGTPVLTCDSGAFTEYVPPMWRCHTAKDWLQGLDNTAFVVPDMVRDYVLPRFGMAAVGSKYHGIFNSIPEIRARGFYAGAPKE